MNSIQSACFSFTMSSDSKKESLFAALIQAHLHHEGDNEKLSDSNQNFISHGFDTSTAKQLITDLFLQEVHLRKSFLKLLLKTQCSTHRTDNIVIELLSLIDYDIVLSASEITDSYNSSPLLALAIKRCNESLFNAFVKCKMDLNQPHKEISKNEGSYKTAKTLFTEGLKEALKHINSQPNANFAIDYLLAQPFLDSNWKDIEQLIEKDFSIVHIFKSHKVAVYELLCSNLEVAKICDKHGFKLKDYEDSRQYANQESYAERTIKDVFKGYCGEVNLANDLLERDYTKINASEAVNCKNAIEAILFSEGAHDEGYLSPLFDAKYVLDNIISILKEASKAIFNKEKMLKEKVSLTLSFFERLLGKESLLFDDNAKSTKVLFGLTKSNYALPMIDHYMKKLGAETLASNASGVQQAIFVMEWLDIDPITMMTWVKKESVKNQLMECISKA